MRWYFEFLNTYQLIELPRPSHAGYHHKEKGSYQAQTANYQLGKI